MLNINVLYTPIIGIRLDFLKKTSTLYYLQKTHFNIKTQNEVGLEMEEMYTRQKQEKEIWHSYTNIK